jgi:hypothetical protein
MTDDEFDWSRLLNDFRKSASVKAGAVMFGEAQTAYYETLKQHMSEEDAFNMLAHTTECIIKGLAEAAGPVAQVLVQATVVWERMSRMSEKEVPGSGT